MWYRFAINVNELQLTPELMKRLRELNKQAPEATQAAFQEYIEAIRSAQPEEKEAIYNAFIEKLKRTPYIPNPKFPSFDEWRSEYTPERVREEYGPGEYDDRLNKDLKKLRPDEAMTPEQEQAFQEKMLQDLYSRSSDVEYLDKELDIQSEGEGVSEKRKEIANTLAKRVADHLLSELPDKPVSSGGTTTTFLTGMPSPRKMRLEYPRNQKLGKPLRRTKRGILLDTLELDRLFLGHQGGRGTGNTGVYSDNARNRLLEGVAQKGYDLVVPIIGNEAGRTHGLRTMIARALAVDPYRAKVKVVLVDTDPDTASTYYNQRAEETGLVTKPYTDVNAFRSAFEEVQNDVQSPEGIEKILQQIITIQYRKENPGAQKPPAAIMKAKLQEMDDLRSSLSSRIQFRIVQQ